jgi:hypothetical protein
MGDTLVVADRETCEFIAAHGGNVYVWADDDGLKHVGLSPPDEPVQFVELAADGFVLLAN